MASDDTDAVDLSDKKLTKIPEDVLQKCNSICTLNLSNNQGILLTNDLRRFTNVTKLVLNQCNLRGIPDEIWELAQIEYLSLENNAFSASLSPVVGRLRRLKVLNLNTCKLTSLPDFIGDLEQLEELYLDDNDFSESSIEIIGRLRQLKTLHIRRCKLTSLPDFIGDLELLEWLSINGNKLSGGLNPEIARLCRLKRLGLGGCGLTCFPEVIGDLVMLESVSLENNDFSKSSKITGRFRQLKILNLNNCKLTSLPDFIGDLELLEILNLRDNDFSKCSIERIGLLRRLKELVLNNCQLTSLPDCIGELEMLEILNLRDNDFSKCSIERIGLLRRLKELVLNNCQLTSLPDCIGELEMLEFLYLSENDLSKCSIEKIGRLRRLKTLTLNNCKLTSLPVFIGELELLEFLNLRENDLSKCSIEKIGRLRRLKTLDLNNCKLTSLPDFIGELELLEELYVRGNNLTGGLNPAIVRLLRLKKLVLSDCGLTYLPEAIGDLVMLESLHLNDNDFSKCSIEKIGRLRRLKELTLNNCKLTSLPDFIGELELLDDLFLCDNDFSKCSIEQIGRLRRLKTLLLNNCKLTTLPDFIGELELLEILYLYDNDFSKCSIEKIGRLRRLKELTLSNCKLTSIPDFIGLLELLEMLCFTGNKLTGGLNPAIGRLHRLKKLFLSDCGLTYLPEAIGDLVMLEKLWLSGNNFSGGLNKAIGRLRRLKKLICNGCELRSLPISIGDLAQLKTLEMTDNRLEQYPACTLQLKELQKLDLSNKNLVNGNRIKSLPVQVAHTNLVTLNVHGNPITEPPKEIWSQGTSAIKSYMLAINQGWELMRADTINMIGDPGAGKTSVAQSLIARSPKLTSDANPTHILQQGLMQIDENNGLSVMINDFGGREIYHTVMPIFLPTNGLIILVYNMSDENQETAVRKWMLTAVAKSSDIRLIIVGTRAEQVTSSEQRLTFEERMRTFAQTVLRDAVDEVKAHANHLESLLYIEEDKSKNDKLNALGQLLVNLKNATIHIVTLSCVAPDVGLGRLRDVILKCLKPLETMPVHWCRVINGIFNQGLDCLYITLEQVEVIAKAHFTEADGSEALTTILRYLARTSQIIWLENHPLLQNVIFHSPQKIINICKKILHHNNEAPNLEMHYQDELEQYKQGILLQPLLRELLSAGTENVSRGEDKGVCESRSTCTLDVVVNLLQQFNLISCWSSESKIKQLIVPSKLASTEPPRLHELKKKGNESLNRITVRLSFIGSLIPMSLFETSLSSMLTVANELDQCQLLTQVWKDGIIIQHDGVTFYAKRDGADITLTAFAQPADRNPWTLLYPVLKHLNDNVISSWRGAPPSCAILCPWCLRQSRSDDDKAQVGAIRADLAKLVANTEQRSARPTCQTCMKDIPRSLCFVTTAGGSTINHEREIYDFFNNIESASEEPCTKLEKQWKRSTSIIKKWLTYHDVEDAMDDLYHTFHVTELQYDQLKAVTKRGDHRESVTALIEIVGRCGSETIEKCLHHFDSKGAHLSQLAQSVRSAPTEPTSSAVTPPYR